MNEIEELRASRARVLEAADAERRRTERSLHDGIQQHLVALAVNLQLARQLVDSDPGALASLLEELSRDVRDALEGVRELSRQIYPPLLLDLGLANALRSAAVEAGATVEVDVHERYDAVAEAAVYFCCVELMRSDAHVRAWAEPDALLFQADGEPTASIADRLDAIGGTLDVVDGRLTGRVPLSRPQRGTR
jgi:hypothetical protein